MIYNLIKIFWRKILSHTCIVFFMFKNSSRNSSSNFSTNFSLVFFQKLLQGLFKDFFQIFIKNSFKTYFRFLYCFYTRIHKKKIAKVFFRNSSMDSVWKLLCECLWIFHQEFFHKKKSFTSSYRRFSRNSFIKSSKHKLK